MLSGRLNRPEAFADIITVSPSMRAIFQYVEAVAASPRPLLITGETGVGKELVARAVHVLSGRKGELRARQRGRPGRPRFRRHPLRPQEGRFHRRLEARAGLLEQAAGGTLFLDEIGDLSAVSQVKLLRLLQDGEYLPLGSDIAKRSDARVVVATNQDLESARNAGRFRKDLYYRLCGHHVHIPPLRERREDLPVLLDHFLDEAAAQPREATADPAGGARTSCSPPTTSRATCASSSPWSSTPSACTPRASSRWTPSNPRSSGASRTWPARPPRRNRRRRGGSPSTRRCRRSGRSRTLLVEEALRRSGGNQAIAATMLGITRQALNKRLNKPAAEG